MLFLLQIRVDIHKRLKLHFSETLPTLRLTFPSPVFPSFQTKLQTVGKPCPLMDPNGNLWIRQHGRSQLHKHCQWLDVDVCLVNCSRLVER